MGLTRFSDIARLYFPNSRTSHSASCSMSRMLKRCRPLYDELARLGRRSKDKYLSELMVSKIAYYLGEP